MTSPLLLLTGFEPFLDVAINPSGELARELIADPPAGLRLAGGVLPVSIERVPAAYDALVAAAGEAPAALVSLGVQRESYFRLERRARAALTSDKRDNDGRLASGTVLEGAADLETTLALEPLADALRAAGAGDVRLSDDAGGYVCERTYHHVLRRAEEAGVPGLFLHIPPAQDVAVESQFPIVSRLLGAVASQLA
ncbi:MAG: hypothetical protein AAF682_24315 [Planctomycetota bacterium]